MPKIKPVAASLSSHVLGAFQQSKPMESLANFYNKDLEKAIAYVAVGSIIAKDGIGCYKYVTQSLKNDKIPEDKRKFVAALDLTNGVLMITAQILMFFAMRKYSEPLFNRLFKKSFNNKMANNIATRLRIAARKADETIERKLNIGKGNEQVRKNALDLFKFIAELSAATIIGKRVLVPFIATPLADKVKQKMDKHSSPDKENNNVKPQEPAVKTAQETPDKAAGKQLDITSSSTNLLSKYKNTNSNLLNKYQQAS